MWQGREGPVARSRVRREIAVLVSGAGLLAAGLAGCRRGGIPDADAWGATTPEGIYDFSARVRGADVRGNFAISGTSIVFTAPDGSCQQPPQEASTRVVEYRTVICGGTAGLRSLTFRISVLHPTRRSTLCNAKTRRLLFEKLNFSERFTIKL